MSRHVLRATRDRLNATIRSMTALDAIQDAASLLVPPRCGVCGAGCAPRAPACERCVGNLRAAAPVCRALSGFDAVVGAAPYAGTARRLVAALKFGPRPRLGAVAAEGMARALAEVEGATARTVVPVPPAPRRLARRGFDPADVLATALARRLDLPLARPLARRGGRRQVGRVRSARLASPPRMRCVAAPPARVVLVDDVLTTGATLAAAARALRGAGTAEIVALVFAVATPGRGRSSTLASSAYARRRPARRGAPAGR